LYGDSISFVVGIFALLL